MAAVSCQTPIWTASGHRSARVAGNGKTASFSTGSRRSGPKPRCELSRIEAQQRLVQLGYVLGSIDGVFGPATRRQIANFQTKEQLLSTGYLDTVTAVRLNLNTVTPGLGLSSGTRAARSTPNPFADWKAKNGSCVRSSASRAGKLSMASSENTSTRRCWGISCGRPQRSSLRGAAVRSWRSIRRRKTGSYSISSKATIASSTVDSISAPSTPGSRDLGSVSSRIRPDGNLLRGGTGSTGKLSHTAIGYPTNRRNTPRARLRNAVCRRSRADRP